MLKNTHMPYQAYFTEYPRHALHIAKRICMEDKEEKTIVVAGGDGTMNEVINGLPSFRNVTIGYIPAGSGNDLSRGLGISRDPLKAIKTILKPNGYIYTDIGALTIQKKSGIRKLRIFYTIPALFFSRHIHMKGVQIYRCKAASIQIDKPLAIHTDDEVHSAKMQLQTAIYPEKLRFIV